MPEPGRADGEEDQIALAKVGDPLRARRRDEHHIAGSHLLRRKATNLDPTDGEHIESYVVVSGKVTKDGTADFAVLGWDWDAHGSGKEGNGVWFYKGASGAPKRTKKMPLPGGVNLLTQASATIADFDRNGYGDLTLGSRHSGKGGTVYVFPGTSTGPGRSCRKSACHALPANTMRASG